MLRGRDSQLAAVEKLLGRARDGCGGALAVHAEPGMGKTALLEAAARMAATDFRVFGIRGVRDESELPLAGLHRLLLPLSDQVASLPAHQAEALAPVLAGTGRADEPLALYAAVTALLSQVAASGPVLCWADDVHQLDSMSLNALAFAARRLGPVPVAMLFAAHNEHLAKEAYGRLAGISPLPLPPLDEAAGRQVLADRCPAGIDDDLAAALAELAGGNPLALVELATALTPAQLCGAEPPPETLPLNSRLRAIYRRRFFRLSRDSRMLTLLAVADDRLDAATLAKAAAAGGLDLRELEAARAAGLLRVDGDSISLPSPVLRGALYADAPLAQRRAVHDLLARVLDGERDWARRVWHRTALAGGPDEELGAELAAAGVAAGAAGHYADAVRAWTRAATLTAHAGDRAARLLAAARHAWLGGRSRQARALLRRVQPPPGEDDRLRATADLLRGEIELRDGAPATARRLFLDAADRLVPLDRRAAIAAMAYAGEASCVDGDLRQYVLIARRVAPLRRPGEEPDVELLIAHIEGMAATYRERHREAAGPLRRVLELASGSEDCTAKIWAGIAALILADDRRAQEFATQAAGLAYGTDGPMRPWALTLLVIAEFWLGHYKTAADHSLEGLRLARAMAQENYAAEHLALLALLSAMQGDKETTLLRLGAMSDVATRRGLARSGAFGSWAHACLELIQDHPAAAAGRMRLMAGIWHVHPLIQVMATPHFVEAAVRCGQTRGARHVVEAFDRWATSTGSAARLALAERCRALLADDDAEAEEHFREAIALHHHKGTSAFELARTELLYGNLLRRGRKPLAAREHLRSALQIFRYYDAGYWTDFAQAELRATGEAAPDAAQKNAEDLTTQQLQIARLAAEGATNKEIAARLILSPRTVEHHLRNVFVRLGIRSRTELSRYFR